MVWSWLSKIMKGKKEKNASLHTMGPEELLTDEGEVIKSPTGEEEKYSPIESVHDPKRTREEHEEKEEEYEPVLETNEKKEKTLNKKEAVDVMTAALFMSSKAVSPEELGKTAGIPLLKTRMYASEMIDSFNARNTALEIVEDVGGYRMRVRSPYDEQVSHLAGSGELSPAEMKTLAFIAYKQPLIQSQLVQVRSNTAYEHLQVLVEKGFVSREPKGRTFVLRTTKKFSEYFGTHALKLKPIVKEETNKNEKLD
ncbi:MAG: SMC-Scp complex subunit ScpB [Candidatus Diapherotrites archaeon]